MDTKQLLKLYFLNFLALVVLIPNLVFAENKFFSLPFYEPTTLLQGWFYNDGTIHKGVDYRCSVGDPVYAVADGIAMHSVQKINSTYAYGNFVFIKHKNDFASLYAHLSKVNSKIIEFPEKERGNIEYEKWTPVIKGEYIGDCGNTGTVSPHLHFEATTGVYGLGKTDAYDLYKVSSFYPFNDKYTEMGKNHLWESEPPKYLKKQGQEPQPKQPDITEPDQQSFWDKIKGWFGFRDDEVTEDADSSENKIIETENSEPAEKKEEKVGETKDIEAGKEQTYSLKFINSNETVSVTPGEELKIVVKAKNTGTTVWERNNISTNVVGGRDANKDFYNNSWVTNLRPVLLDQKNVPAGESGTFSFSINTPKDSGNYNFRIQIVRTNANFEQIEGGIWNVKIIIKNIEEPVVPEEELKKEDNLIEKVVKGIKEVAKEVKEKVKKVFYGGGGGGGEEGSTSPSAEPYPEPKTEPELDDPVMEVLSHNIDSINNTNMPTTTIFGTKNEVVARVVLDTTSTIEYASSTWSVDLELSEGENIFEIYGEREDGERTTTSTVYIFLELEKPEPELDDPMIEITNYGTETTNYIKNSTTTIFGTKNEVVTNIVLNIPAILQMTSTTWSLDIDLNEGENNIEIYGERDDGVKTETKTISIILDTSAPEPPTITAIQTGFSTPTLYISWSSLDGEVFDVEYNSGGEWQNLFEKTTSTDFIMEAERLKPYNFRARVYDEMENVSDWNITSVITDWPKDVVINEVAWNGTGPTSAQIADEWIELYNNTDQDINISGWKLSASGNLFNFKSIINPIIPAKGYFLLERTDDSTVLDIAADILYTGGLGNNGENLLLSDENGNIIDQVDCSRGWYNLPDSAKYRTMSRIDPNLPGSWDFNWESAGGVSPNANPSGGGKIFGSPKYRNNGNWLIVAPQHYYSYLVDENNKITFGAENSPYVIDYSVEIPTGYTLQFESGTVLYGKDKSSYFKVKGNLILNGTQESPIIITSGLDQTYVQENLGVLSGSPAPGDWSRIALSPAASLNASYAKFLYGGRDTFFSLDGMFAGKKISQIISNIGGSISLNNVEFSHNYYIDGLYPDYNSIIWNEAPNGHDASAVITNSIFNGGWRAFHNSRPNNLQTLSTELTGNTFSYFLNPSGPITYTRDEPIMSNNTIINP